MNSLWNQFYGTDDYNSDKTSENNLLTFREEIKFVESFSNNNEEINPYEDDNEGEKNEKEKGNESSEDDF